MLPSYEDPENKGIFLSRKNKLENNKRKFNLEHLMAFGTAATCYVPTERRQGGKEPSQRRELLLDTLTTCKRTVFRTSRAGKSG